MRLIDSDKLKETIQTAGFDSNFIKQLREFVWLLVLDKIDKAPTVDPVKRGHWEEDVAGMPRCSYCKHPAYFLMRYTLFDFCPYCGADMRSDKNVASDL